MTPPQETLTADEPPPPPPGADRRPHAPNRRRPGRAVVFGGLLVAGLFAVAGVVVAAGGDNRTAGTPAVGVAEMRATAASGASTERPDGPAGSPTVGADVGMSLGRAAVVGPIVSRLGPVGDIPTGNPTTAPTATPVPPTPADLSDPDGSGPAESGPFDPGNGPLAPATVSTLSPGDPGFGWPATAFGTAAASVGP